MVLIECLVALFIHLIVGAIVLKVVVENIKSLEERKELFRFYRVVNSICREVDLNYSNCYINTQLSIGEKVISYDKNLEEELISKELFTLENGDKISNYISISLDGDDKYSMKIKIKGSFKTRNIDESIDATIVKNIWENK